MASKRTNARKAREFMRLRAMTGTGYQSKNCQLVELSKNKRIADMNTTILNYILAKAEAVRKPNPSSENKVIELEKKALFTGALHGDRQDDFTEASVPAILDAIEKNEAADYTPDRKSEIVSHVFDSPVVRAAYEARKSAIAAMLENGNAAKVAAEKAAEKAADALYAAAEKAAASTASKKNA